MWGTTHEGLRPTLRTTFQTSTAYKQMSWPTLTNPATDPIINYRRELIKRQSAFGWWRRDFWRTYRHVYAIWRTIRSFVTSVYAEIASAPKKTLFDVATAVPLGLLVIPQYREWAFQQRYAGVFFVGLVSGRALYAALRRGSVKRLLRDDAARTVKFLMPVVECSGAHVAAASRGEHLPADQLRRNLETVLSAFVDLSRLTLHVPDGTRLSANLMIRMPVRVRSDTRDREGCGIVVYDAIPASPSWTRLVLGDFGAGQVFVAGKVQCVEDAGDPVWCGLFNASRSRCFASFPVRNKDGQVIAVVNIDADRAMIFTRRKAEALFVDVLASPLKLLGDLLAAASVQEHP